MQNLSIKYLRSEIIEILSEQGYKVLDNNFFLQNSERQTKRDAHSHAKIERLIKSEIFIKKKTPLIRKYMLDGKDLDIKKIIPRIIEVQPGTDMEDLFRWWNIVWWSLPHEPAYGRQMRFIIWDDYHNAPIGLIGLQSPILNWSVRDKFLEIPAEKRDFWVNQSLSAQRLGALPPYNDVLGGKLVALLMSTDILRKRFANKYRNKRTILKGRTLPPRLLFITTTGAFGKSSIYTRLKFNDQYVAKFIGYTKGSGSFHIPNSLYETLIKYLNNSGFTVKRGYGNGPSRKLRIIRQALRLLGFNNGNHHGVERALYLFPFVENLKDVIKNNSKPIWVHRNIEEITEYWKNRWALPRAYKKDEYKNYNADLFLARTLDELNSAKSEQIN